MAAADAKKGWETMENTLDVQALRDLKMLYDEGVLTAAEFAAQKAMILGTHSPAAAASVRVRLCSMEVTDEAALSLARFQQAEDERRERERLQSCNEPLPLPAAAPLPRSRDRAALTEDARAEQRRAIGADVLFGSMELVPYELLSHIFAYKSVRDAARLAICCRRLRRESPDLLMRGLDDPSPFVRRAALRELQTFEPRGLAQYAGAVIERLADDEFHVYHDACEFVLPRLEPAVLAQHAGHIVAMIEHENAAESAVWHAVRTLPSAAIAEHETAIAAKLDDDNFRVREGALWALCRLDPVPLHSYFATFVEALTDPEDDVGYASLCCIEQDLQGLAPAALIASYNELRFAMVLEGHHTMLLCAEEKFESKMHELGIVFDGGDY
jgi:HEAT repeat protein